MEKILLASQSPRRRDLLLAAGYQIEIFSPKLSETLDKNLSLDSALQALARQKWETAVAQFPVLRSRTEVLLSADTVVVLGDKLLGKPENRAQAKDYLQGLSGREHIVKTAICIGFPKTGQVLTDVCSTRVGFREISPEELLDYLDSGQWEDKAGAYGIQSQAGRFVVELDGSRNNVIGLPVENLPDYLQRLRQ